MKVMSRNFTRMEKILLVVLALILVALAYYYFVDQNVRTAIIKANADAEEYQMELDGLEKEVARIKGIRDNMEALEASGELSWMGSYNNSEAEVRFLNDILADTLQYSVSFANVTRNGDQIRRNFTLQYRVMGYEAARRITTQLCECDNRCIVGDLSCSIGKDGVVTIRESATFYETMRGGVADAALPAANADVNS